MIYAQSTGEWKERCSDFFIDKQKRTEKYSTVFVTSILRNIK